MTRLVAVVDDDARVLESLENLLESAGYAVRLFESGERLLESGALQDIDLLISDIGLPGMDGLELRRVAHRTRPALPIVLITARADVGAARSAEGRPTILRKPFDCRALLAALAAAMSHP